jgi:GT2 family glycosyltransferase
VVVVDNAGVERERAGIDRLVVPDDNLGFTGGANLGAREASGDVLLFLNPDTVVTPGAIAALVGALDDPEVGIAMASLRLLDDPATLNSSGTVVHVTGIGWAGGYGEQAGSGSGIQDVAAPSGAAMAVRAETFAELGGFAEELFMYIEDLELGWRARIAGYRVVLVPGAEVLHEYEYGRNPRKSYLLERNRLVFVLSSYSTRLLVLLGRCSSRRSSEWRRSRSRKAGCETRSRDGAGSRGTRARSGAGGARRRPCGRFETGTSRRG